MLLFQELFNTLEFVILVFPNIDYIGVLQFGSIYLTWQWVF